MKNLIGEKIVIEYFDQNENFKAICPQSGKIVREHIDQYKNVWYLIKLDKPIDYYPHEYTHFLVRSRWVGYDIKGDKPTSVFVMLIPDEKALEKNPININDFEMAFWGMVK